MMAKSSFKVNRISATVILWVRVVKTRFYQAKPLHDTAPTTTSQRLGYAIDVAMSSKPAPKYQLGVYMHRRRCPSYCMLNRCECRPQETRSNGSQPSPNIKSHLCCCHCCGHFVGTRYGSMLLHCVVVVQSSNRVITRNLHLAPIFSSEVPMLAVHIVTIL